MSWWTRLSNTLRRGKLDQSLEDEIQDHLERRAAALRASGLSTTEAHRRARAAFGSLDRVREESREIRVWSGLETTLQDMRYAWRGLRRNPGFSITALASLSLAIAAITAIYAVIDAAMLRHLPVPQPQQLFTLSVPPVAQVGPGASGEEETFSYPTYQQVRDAVGDVARVAIVSAATRVEAQVPDRSAPIERLVQQYVSGEAFETFGIRPALGQLRSGADEVGPGGAAGAVVSFDYWHRRFGRDPTIVNRTVVVNGRTYRIVGVAADGFSGVEPGRFVDVWLPVTAFDPGVFTNPSARLFRIVGRLSAGTSRQHMQQRLASLNVRVNHGAIGLSAFRSAFGGPLAIISSVALAILLIAVANVASLLMGRSTARAEEMALRVSLGAGRSRLVRQLLTESALLSGLAGAVGWLLANLAAPWLIALLSTSSDPLQFALSMNTRVLWFCVGVCGLCAVGFGLIPAWTTALAPMLTLRQAAGPTTTVRISRLFVGLQMTFAFCLVIAATGFLFSLYKLFTVDAGFHAADVTVLTLRSERGIGPDGLRLTQDLRRQVATLPNVENAAVGWWAIFGGSKRIEPVVVAGRPPSVRQEIFYRVSPGYFATLQTPLLEGRDLDDNDTEARQPIPTIVNRSFEGAYFEDHGALGRVFERTDGARHVVVGIAADSHYDDLRGGPQPIAYFPMKPPRFFTMYVRSPLDPGAILKLVEREAAASAPGIRVTDVTTLQALVGDTVVTETLLANLGGVFAAIGLVLAAIGAFGIVNYTVLRRTKEIGIRAALGARRGALVALVVRDFVGIVLVALAAGLFASVGAMSFVRSQLFGIGPAEPAVIVGALVLFLGTTAVAVLIPVLRAAAIDPIVAVRHD